MTADASATRPGENPDCVCRHSLGAHVGAKVCRFCSCEEFHDPSAQPPTPIERALDIAALNPAFRGIPHQHLAEMAKYGHQRHFMRDEVLLEEGHTSRCIYFLLAGAVKVERAVEAGPPQPIDKLGQGEFVGEMGLLHELPRSATVTAMEDVEVLELSLEHLKQVFRAYPDLLLAFGRLIQHRQHPTQH